MRRQGPALSVLLLNAGSSSLKGVLIRAEDRTVVARSSADWAGPVTRYQCSGPGVEIGPTEVSWRGHAEALRQAVRDLEPARAGLDGGGSAAGHAEPAPESLPDRLARGGAGPPDWGHHSRSRALCFTSPGNRFRLHAMLNAYWEPLRLQLPPTAQGPRAHWRRWIDTALPVPAESN